MWVREWTLLIIYLNTINNYTYFLFPNSSEFNATKIQFATEYLYKLSQKNSSESCV